MAPCRLAFRNGNAVESEKAVYVAYCLPDIEANHTPGSLVGDSLPFFPLSLVSSPANSENVDSAQLSGPLASRQSGHLPWPGQLSISEPVLSRAK